ncbi:MFS transporter [Micromonosporaceae bacterium Da 78-11]
MWRTPGLLPLFVAKLISTFGSWLTLLALPWFVLVTTGSPVQMSAVLTAEFLGVVVLGLPSGRLVARLGLRRTMLIADAARVPLMASVPLLHQAGWLSLPALLAVSFSLGVFTAPYVASQRLILADLLGPAGADEGLLARANSLIDAATRLAALAGPAAGGVLIALFGPAEVLWIDAATYAVSFVILFLFVRPPGAGVRAPGVVARDSEAGARAPGAGVRASETGLRPPGAGVCTPETGVRPPGAGVCAAETGVRPPENGMRLPGAVPRLSEAGVGQPESGRDEAVREGPAERTVETSVLAGLRHALRHPALRRFLLALVFACLSIPAISACLPVLVVREMAGDPRILGLLTAANGAGLALGSLIAVAGLARMRDTALTAAAVLLGAPLWLLLTGRIALLVVALFLIGVATPVLAATINTRFTLRTPVVLRPHVLTAMATAENLANFVAFAAAGPALAAVGLRPVFAAIAVLASFGAAAFIAALRVDRRDTDEATARARAAEPAPAAL